MKKILLFLLLAFGLYQSGTCQVKKSSMKELFKTNRIDSVCFKFRCSHFDFGALTLHISRNGMRSEISTFEYDSLSCDYQDKYKPASISCEMVDYLISAVDHFFISRSSPIYAFRKKQDSYAETDYPIISVQLFPKRKYKKIEMLIGGVYYKGKKWQGNDLVIYTKPFKRFVQIMTNIIVTEIGGEVLDIYKEQMQKLREEKDAEIFVNDDSK